MKHFIYDNLDFEYQSHGNDNGEPIVLLHGFPRMLALGRRLQQYLLPQATVHLH